MNLRKVHYHVKVFTGPNCYGVNQLHVLAYLYYLVHVQVLEKNMIATGLGQAAMKAFSRLVGRRGDEKDESF